MSQKPIKSALISVYYKEGLEPLIQTLVEHNVVIYSTGGTAKYIEDLGYKVVLVESLTGYPSILGGRVKTLHPKVFGGILARRALAQDMEELTEFDIPAIDLIVVDLYPFTETLAQTDNAAEIIEKIDIGGVSLIRAAAKNFEDTAVISRKMEYSLVGAWLQSQSGKLHTDQRRTLAAVAFEVTKEYDSAIAQWFAEKNELRYGENPHQKARFEGDLNSLFQQLNGKELSYNNLLDADAAVRLVLDVPRSKPAFAIIKHNNACGFAIRDKLHEAYKAALEADPVSAFGGILACNQHLDELTATAMNDLFFEICIAPSYSKEALEILQSKKNRIILKWNMDAPLKNEQNRTILNGALVQDSDTFVVEAAHLKYATVREPNEKELSDLLFANILVKHTKSNAIVLARDGQLLASGTGQTSRVDALRQAINKAISFGFNLKGAVMASDAFFPFPDCVEIANEAGIAAVIQPGGSIKDKDSIAYCDSKNMAMVMTGIRHFKH